nr:hypothetical protein [Tanacetum cinerariifolium]
MSTPKFTDVHNLVALLSKPTEFEGFEQIINFSNANPTKYALTVNPTIYTSCIEQFWATATAKNINREAQIHAKVDGKKVIISEATIRRDLKFEDEGEVVCLSNEVIFEQLPLMSMVKHLDSETKFLMYPSVKRVATTATSLDAEQDKAIISKTQFTTTLNEQISIGTSSGSGPWRQETLGDAAAQTRSERVSKFSNDLPLLRVNTLGSGEDRLQLKGLMELCTKLSKRVLDLKKTKTAQAKEIANLKKRVKRLERKKKSISHGLKSLYKGRIKDIDADDNITLVNDQVMFDADRDLQGKEVIARQEKEVLLKEIQYVQNVVEKYYCPITTAVTDATTTDMSLDDITLAQALVEIKTSKPKARDRLTEEKAQLIEDENLAWDNVQTMIDADYELAASKMNERQMQSKEGKIDSSKALDDDLVVTEISGTESEKHDTRSRSRNDAHAEDEDIKLVNEKEPMIEVQLTAQSNVLANEQQHSVQSEPIYDTYLLEKVDRNITPDSTNMSHKGGEIEC